jgi:hypothetical protein
MRYQGEIEADGHDDACDVGGEIYNAVKDLTTQTIRIMQRHDDCCTPNHLYVCLSAAAGAIAVAAKLMSIPDIEGEELARWADLPATREAILAAALLMTRCTVPASDGVVIEYNAANIKAALEAMAKVTGNSDYSMLAPQLVETVSKLPPTEHFFDNTDSVQSKVGINTLN